jgi:hypothetical protein
MLLRAVLRSATLRGAALGAFCLSMAGDLSAPETAAALAIAALTVVLSIVHSGAAGQPVRPRGPWGRVARQVAGPLARETFRVAGTLARSLVQECRGRIVRIPFPVHPTTAGQRALAELMSSVAPDGIAIDAPPAGAETLRVHRLTEGGRRPGETAHDGGTGRGTAP